MKGYKGGLAAVLAAGLMLAGCAENMAVTAEKKEPAVPSLSAAPTETAPGPTLTPEPAPVALEGAATSFPQYLDLDGDGVKELVELVYPEEAEETEESAAPTEEEEKKLLFSITRGEESWQAEVPMGEEPRFFAADGGEGEILLLEIRLDETIFRVYGWRFTGEALEPLTFEEEPYFCGRAESLHGRRLTLHRWVDLLGTYEMERDYRLIGDKFMPAEDAWGVVDDTPDYPLTVLEELYALSEGDEAGTEFLLPAGMGLRIVATDLKEKVWFEADTGESGYLFMEQDEEGRFSFFSGVEETEAFSGMPYAG